MSESLNIKAGEQMPDIELPAYVPGEGEQTFDLASYRGRPVVLFWYPKADTPGWTKEAVGFRELSDKFDAANAVVCGASKDSVNAQRKFAQKFDLNMPLLSDTGNRVRALLGNPDGGEPVSRITYVIDAEGKVAEVIGVPGVLAADHPARALEAVERLK